MQMRYVYLIIRSRLYIATRKIILLNSGNIGAFINNIIIMPWLRQTWWAKKKIHNTVKTQIHLHAEEPTNAVSTWQWYDNEFINQKKTLKQYFRISKVISWQRTSPQCACPLLLTGLTHVGNSLLWFWKKNSTLRWTCLRYIDFFL